MEAASPADVSFWPIHPTMERLLQYKMIVRPFTDLNWANDASNDNLPGDGTTLCEYTDESQCEGHHGYDITTFVTSSIDPNTGVVTNDYLTNGELLHSIDPNDYKMTCVDRAPAPPPPEPNNSHHQPRRFDRTTSVNRRPVAVVV